MKYQVIIIGGGPAGYTAAEAAGKAGLSVLLFEKQNLGGVCLNEGCIPTKTLLYSAKTYDGAKHASKYAVTVPEVFFDLPKIIARKSKVVRKLVLGVKSKLTSNNVTIISGEATILDKNTVRCGEETYECDNLILCTGSETFIPPISGIDSVNYWTHREALDNKELPASLAIVGGGVIGMEFASFFNSLGVKVTVIEMMDEILGGMDKELSALLRADYAKRGIQFLLSTKVVSLAQTEEGAVVSYENAEGAGSVIAEKLLMSVGRRPVTKGFGLENLNLQRTERGSIVVNGQMESSLPGVYVCGDLTGFSLLAHTAVREAEVAVHAILGKEDRMSYAAIPDLREQYHPGDELTCVVKQFDRRAGTLEISVKETVPNPFDEASLRHPVGCRRRAIIAGKYAGGVFCNLPDGAVIMCRYSFHYEDSDFKTGDTVMVVIQRYDEGKKQIFGKIVGR